MNLDKFLSNGLITRVPGLVIGPPGVGKTAAIVNWGRRNNLRTWTIVASPPSHLPKDGDIVTVASAVAVVKEGCRQALDEAATRRQHGKVGNYTHVNTWPFDCSN
jgi:hypothetical protein